MLLTTLALGVGATFSTVGAIYQHRGRGSDLWRGLLFGFGAAFTVVGVVLSITS